MPIKSLILLWFTQCALSFSLFKSASDLLTNKVVPTTKQLTDQVAPAAKQITDQVAPTAKLVTNEVGKLLTKKSDPATKVNYKVHTLTNQDDVWEVKNDVADKVYALDGDDLLVGFDGDIIYGGKGNDILYSYEANV